MSLWLHGGGIQSFDVFQYRPFFFPFICFSSWIIIHAYSSPLGFLDDSLESVHTTVGELEENLNKGILTAGSTSKTHMAHAKVVGIACDVCQPDDVRKLANFAASELGSIDIWVGIIIYTQNLILFTCFLHAVTIQNYLVQLDNLQ